MTIPYTAGNMTEDIPQWIKKAARALKRSPPPQARAKDAGVEDRQSAAAAVAEAAAAVKKLPRAASNDQLPRLIEATGYASDREGDDD